MSAIFSEYNLLYMLQNANDTPYIYCCNTLVYFINKFLESFGPKLDYLERLENVDPQANNQKIQFQAKCCLKFLRRDFDVN